MVSRSGAARREASAVAPSADLLTPPTCAARRTGAPPRAQEPESRPPSGCVEGSGLRQGSTTAGDGDGLDFDELYERWFGEVSRWVRALGGPAADREDLVQDVFLVAYRRLPDFDGRNPAGWLYRIARRRVRDFRRLRWFKVLVGRRELLPDTTPDQEGSPAEHLEHRQTGDLLERLLDRLPPDQRAAFVLFEVEGCSGQEIAELQGVPLNTVWARIHSARKKLKGAIEQSFAKELSR